MATAGNDESGRVRRVLRAACVAGAVSGIPSALAAVRAQRDPFSPTRAAGRMLRPDEQRLLPLVGAAAVVHTVLSIGWASVIATTLPRGAGRVRASVHGALLGAAIGALDLGIAHSFDHPRLRAIAKLETTSQLADHVTFGAVTGLMLAQPKHSRRG
jgi:hypothetical protein